MLLEDKLITKDPKSGAEFCLAERQLRKKMQRGEEMYFDPHERYTDGTEKTRRMKNGKIAPYIVETRVCDCSCRCKV